MTNEKRYIYNCASHMDTKRDRVVMEPATTRKTKSALKVPSVHVFFSTPIMYFNLNRATIRLLLFKGIGVAIIKISKSLCDLYEIHGSL